jgi:tetratricopeptide (TPR) repeat protein
LGNVGEAETLYSKVLAIEKTHVLAQANLAMLYHMANDNAERAEEHYKRALDWSPARPGYFTLGIHISLSLSLPLSLSRSLALSIYSRLRRLIALVGFVSRLSRVHN